MDIAFYELLELEVIINLCLALVLGGLIGFFREKEGKVAGLRTHILVCVGAALAMAISLHMGRLSPSADPSRIAEGVVAGIGFLGAGAIIQAGASVRGLTTAASIWGSAVIGLAVGSGFYTGAITATLITLFALQVLRDFEHKFIHKGKNG